MPRVIDLKEPQWNVVSTSKIANPCVKNEEGKRLRQKIDNVWVCDLGKENDWPDGYTYFDKFVDDIKKQHGGDLVFIAMSVADYELMSYNTQELKRYISQLGEVIVYYKDVTTPTETTDGVQ